MASDMMDVDGDEKEADDFEWEYEYHDNETEDFYIVLDIPTGKKVANAANVDIFAPMVQSKPKKPRTTGTGRGRGRRNVRASRGRGGAVSRVEVDGGDPPVAQDDSDEDEPASQNGTTESVAAEPVQEPAQAINGKAEAPPSDFQLMDLNSDNPIISYGGTLYSCQWASSIGSDLLFTKKPLEKNTKQHVLHSFDEWDLVAIGAAKLIASPATFQRRQPTSANVTQVDKSKYDSENKALQADFIKRLADIKKRMGEPIGSMLSSIQPAVQAARVAPSSSATPASEPSTRGRGTGRGRLRGRGRRGRGQGTTTSPASTTQPILVPVPQASITDNGRPHNSQTAPATSASGLGKPDTSAGAPTSTFPG